MIETSWLVCVFQSTRVGNINKLISSFFAKSVSELVSGQPIVISRCQTIIMPGISWSLAISSSKILNLQYNLCSAKNTLHFATWNLLTSFSWTEDRRRERNKFIDSQPLQKLVWNWIRAGLMWVTSYDGNLVISSIAMHMFKSKIGVKHLTHFPSFEHQAFQQIMSQQRFLF